VREAEVVWFVMGAAVVAYALTGGADYGGGMWHLAARGKRADVQRRTIERAIAPIWEANHVWLIFVIVALFTAFPKAFAVVSIALHVPITLALLGIVLRGSSLVFHAYDLRDRPRTSAWARTFGASSLVAPFFLGDVLGALSTGAIRWDGSTVTSGFFAAWLTPFALGTGLFAVCLFALLAAVYLTADVESEARSDFRRRAVAMEIVSGAVAALVFWLARADAPVLFSTLAHSPSSWFVEAATAVFALATLLFLAFAKHSLARLTVALQVALVVVGWGIAMRGAIVLPDVRLDNAGARTDVLEALLPALAAGSLLLIPSLFYLFRVFKKLA